MKHTNYIVTFEGGQILEISAFGARQATILAQAKMINRGLNYNVLSVEVAK